MNKFLLLIFFLISSSSYSICRYADTLELCCSKTTIESFETYTTDKDIDFSQVLEKSLLFSKQHKVELERNLFVWIKLKIKNQLPTTHWVIDINSHTSYIDLFYYTDQDSVIHNQAGSRVSYSKRSVNSTKSSHIDFRLKKDEHQTIYLKINNISYNVPTIEKIEIAPSTHFVSQLLEHDWNQAYLQGIFFLLILLSLTGYILQKDKVFLFYFLSLLLQSFLFLFFYNYTEKWIFNDFPRLNTMHYWYLHASGLTYTIFLFLIVKPYFNENSKQYKFFLYGIYYFLFSTFSGLSLIIWDYPLYIMITDYFIFIKLIFVIALSSSFLQFKKKYLNFITLGTYTMIVTVLYDLLKNFGIAESGNYLCSQIGLCLQYTFIFYALILRYIKQETQKNNKILANIEKQYKQKISTYHKDIQTLEERSKNKEIEIKDDESLLDYIKNKYTDTNIENIESKDLTSNFLSKLKIIHPKLKKNDLILCELIWNNKSSKEIAQTLNKDLNTIEVARYRLRKKLELDKGEKLDKYLNKIIKNTTTYFN